MDSLEVYRNFKMADVKFSEYVRQIRTADSLERKVEVLKSVYAFMKEIGPSFYNEKTGFHSLYAKTLISYVPFLESKLGEAFVIHPNINYNEKNVFVSPDFNDATAILTWIVANTRYALIEELKKSKQFNGNIESCSLENYCAFANEMVVSLCENNSILAYEIILEPGFKANSLLCNGYGKHCFIIVKIHNQFYLVDCTYSQFFLLKRCLLERIGVPLLLPNYAGTFMVMHEDRKSIAEEIIQNGFILLTDDVFKAYLDGFAISYRNGLYYEKTQDFSYTTHYSKEDYIRFLKGYDTQLNQEGEMVLGLQKSPLRS